MAEWVASRGFTHFVTLAFNPNKVNTTGTSATLLAGGINRATSRLLGWDARVNRRVLGRRWCSKPDDRMVANAFLENSRTNAHWHLALLPPVTSGFCEFEPVMTAEWKRLEPNGTVDIAPIYDSKKLSEYITKKLGDPECWEHFELLGPRLSK